MSTQCDHDRVKRFRDDNVTILLQYANNKRDLGLFNDVVIFVGNERILANKMVLSCYCKYFETLFLTDHIDQGCLEFNQFDGNALKTIIQYIYTGRIEIYGDNVMKLLATADILQMDDVKRFCFDYFESTLTGNNCLDILRASSSYQNSSSLKKTYQLISNNFDGIMQTKKFKSLSKDEIIHLLAQLDTAKVEESSIYKAIVNWVQHDEKRKTDFPTLFLSCNLHKLPKEFLKNVVAKNVLVQKNSDCINTVVSCFFKKHEGKKKTDGNVRDNDVQHIDVTDIATRLVCVGGVNRKSVMEVYNINETPKHKYPKLVEKLCCHCVLVLHRVVYCIGGVVDDDWKMISNRVYRMDMKETNLRWEQIESMNESRTMFGATILNENLVVCGGWSGKARTNSAELYDIHSHQWKFISSMQHSRMRHALVTAGGILFAIGGIGCRDKRVSTSVERLDSVEDKWKNVKNTIVTRIRFAAVYYNGYIYAIGGDDSMAEKTVEKYDPINDQWEMVKDMNMGRYQHAACVLDGKMFVVGGTRSKGEVNKIESYDAAMNNWMVVHEIEDELVDHALVTI